MPLSPISSLQKRYRLLEQISNVFHFRAPEGIAGYFSRNIPWQIALRNSEYLLSQWHLLWQIPVDWKSTEYKIPFSG